MKRIFLPLIWLLLPYLVYSQSLTTSGLQNMDFGSQLFPGIEKSIAYTEGGSAKYEITGEAGREVQVSFTLPSSLTDGSGNNLTINFHSSDAGYSTSETGQSTAKAFDPKTGIITFLGSDGKLYVWLGGTVSPPSSQPGNPYSGDLVLNVTYTN